MHIQPPKSTSRGRFLKAMKPRQRNHSLTHRGRLVPSQKNITERKERKRERFDCKYHQRVNNFDTHVARLGQGATFNAVSHLNPKLMTFSYATISTCACSFVQCIANKTSRITACVKSHLSTFHRSKYIISHRLTIKY